MDEVVKEVAESAVSCPLGNLSIYFLKFVPRTAGWVVAAGLLQLAKLARAPAPAALFSTRPSFVFYSALVQSTQAFFSTA